MKNLIYLKLLLILSCCKTVNFNNEIIKIETFEYHTNYSISTGSLNYEFNEAKKSLSKTIGLDKIKRINQILKSSIIVNTFPSKIGNNLVFGVLYLNNNSIINFAFSKNIIYDISNKRNININPKELEKFNTIIRD